MPVSRIERRTFLARIRQTAGVLLGGAWLVGSARAQQSKKAVAATGSGT
jgi:hypothetical protein